MLDALMGPDRDSLDKGTAKNEKFKDASVCKPYLVGRCPLDVSLLGGRRKYAVCSLLHSETMKAQMEAHPEAETFKLEYEALALKELQEVVRECEVHINNEKARIREDERWVRKKPPLPAAVNDKLGAMKRESSNMIQRAETLDDDQLREKDELIRKANEIIKDREALLEVETKKAMDAIAPEEVCETCGTAYTGKDGDAAHKQFRIHEAFVKIRDWITELKPRAEEYEKKKQEKKEEEMRKKRKEDWDKAQENEANGKEKRDRDRGDRRDGKSRSHGRDRNRDSRSRHKSREDRRRSRSGGRRRSRSRDRRRR